MSSRRPAAAQHPSHLPPHVQSMAPPPPPGQARQNEYFIPRDGIDREVITSDICRYLGNDALVRPGTYEDPKTGHARSGYFITAYRNLTTAMIEDLKADSARWEQERRAKSSRNAGVHYHHSDTYAMRERGGPSEPNNYGKPGDSFDAPHAAHPGPDGPGYPGYAPQPGSGSYMQPNQPSGYTGGNPSAYPPGPGYSAGSNAYPQQDPGFSAAGQPTMAYAQPPQDAWVHGAARPMAPGYREASQTQQYSPSGMGTRDQMMTTPPSQGSYPPPQPQPGYGASAEYYNAHNAPPGAPYQSMPQDTLYGRGGGAYQERTTSPPGSTAADRMPTAAVVQPPTDVYMQGQQQYEEQPPRTHKQSSGSAQPRRQETPRHQPYKSSGGHR